MITCTAEAAPTTQPFKQAIGPRAWSFPRDHGRHDGFKTEWWYFTGNLKDTGGNAFGYQLTFFRTAFVPLAATRPSPWAVGDLYFAHAAVTDVAGKRFAFRDHLQRGRPGLAEASAKTLDVSLLDWSAKLDESSGMVRLRASEGGLDIDLTCTATREPLLEGPGGLNAKADEVGRASYYYSWTRLKTAGTLAVDGRKVAVEGLSWMDHEFSSDSLGTNQVGWDWMGLQLNDDTDLMIYRLRGKGGVTDHLAGTIWRGTGDPRYLTADDIILRGSDPWTSGTTGAQYPQRWALTVAGLPPMVIRSQLPGQELTTPNSTKVSYFEGAVEVLNDAGRAVGAGYLEMTGYDKSITGGGF